MKNIDRIAKYVTKNGTNGIMIHTVPKTQNWIMAQKIEIDKWLITLLNPMGNVSYNLGIVNEEQHVQLWTELTRAEIETKVAQIQLARELKNKINQFLKKYATKTNKNKKYPRIK